ncbi:uncharacterized protein [Musca autumnalis]|uniref:uncharacterized protein n=1 Tax=Musca autumnalis TaxID=221902 RepID=UPI003CF780DF
MYLYKHLSLGLLFVLVFYKENFINGVDLKLTNLQCKSLNESVVKITECRLKVLRRGVVGLNITIGVLQPLLKKISFLVSCLKMEMGFYKKANGYKPFLYNQTVDLCKMLSKSNHHPVAKILLNVMSGYTNLNHSCPYKTFDQMWVMCSFTAVIRNIMVVGAWHFIEKKSNMRMI